MISVATIERYFREEGFQTCGETHPPDAVGTRQNGKVWTVDLTFGERTRRVVVKDLFESTHYRDPMALVQIHRNITSQVPVLRDNLVNILGANPNQGWIIMEFVPGGTLENILRWGLDSREHQFTPLLRKIADILISMRHLNPSELGISPGTEKKESVIGEFEGVFADRIMRRYLPKAMNCPAAFYTRFNRNFYTRRSESLVPVDCQPKNLLVSRSGMIRLIDPDYTVTSLILAIAQFLVSLDRLGLARPFPRAQSRIRGWQRTLVEAFENHEDPYFAEELAFWYATTLLRVYSRHASKRTWFRPYLRWYYGNRLKAFLDRVTGKPSCDWLRSPMQLFSED